jgi:tRNA(Ile)-lysidine synthetase-like protein
MEQAIIPGQVIGLAGGWELHAETVHDIEAARELAGNNPDPFQAWLGLDAAEDELVLRRRREADRLRPLGMPDGSVKISDLMINLKLPQRARSEWPVVVVKDRVAWVPGCRSSHEFRLTPTTRRAVHLKIVRSEAAPLI